MAHIQDDIRQISRFHDFTALAKDRLALIVHYIIVFQQMFTNVEIAPFDLGLGFFQRFVDPGMHNRLALVHAKGRQHLFQPF